MILLKMRFLLLLLYRWISKFTVLTPRLPQIRPKKVIKILESVDFIKRRQTGSHVVLRNPDTKLMTVVPVHAKNLKKGTLRAIISQSGLSRGDFLKLYEKM